jgi:hypothetical protein
MINNYNYQSPSRKPLKGLPILLNKGILQQNPPKRSASPKWKKTCWNFQCNARVELSSWWLRRASLITSRPWRRVCGHCLLRHQPTGLNDQSSQGSSGPLHHSLHSLPLKEGRGKEGFFPLKKSPPFSPSPKKGSKGVAWKNVRFLLNFRRRGCLEVFFSRNPTSIQSSK